MPELLFLQDPKIKLAFEEIISCLDGEYEVFLVSGSVRNSLFHHFHQQKLPQRDFDAVIIGNPDNFIKNLKNKGRSDDGKIQKTNGIILNKTKTGIPNPEHTFQNKVFLDLIFSEENKNIEANLKENANFTINGGAINLKDIFTKNRIEKIITLETTIPDIQNLELKLNNPENCDGANIFAAIRFASQGFHKPNKSDLEIMLSKLEELPKYRLQRNIEKCINYVGSLENAQKILQNFDIKQNIFEIK